MNASGKLMNSFANTNRISDALNSIAEKTEKLYNTYGLTATLENISKGDEANFKYLEQIGKTLPLWRVISISASGKFIGTPNGQAEGNYEPS